jgi:hypothetical protein
VPKKRSKVQRPSDATPKNPPIEIPFYSALLALPHYREEKRGLKIKALSSKKQLFQVLYKVLFI